MDKQAMLTGLMELFGPSGYEGEVAKAFYEIMRSTADGVEIDRVGNVIARYEGTDADAPVVMAFGHMDSLGFIVRKIEHDGFLGLDRLGGVPEKVLPGLNLSIRTLEGGLVNGVIGNKSHHAASAEDKTRVDPITSLYVDIGAKSAEQVRALGIEVGCPAVYQPYAQRLAGDFISGTAIDNRGALTALAVAGEHLQGKPHAATVYLVGTVWEEFNLRGAMLAARRICPDITIGLDVVLAGDTRDLENRYETVCGAGPVLQMYSFHGRGTLNGTLPHEGLSKLVRCAAADENIPLQHFAGIGILTDSAYAQLENGGTAAIELGFPARYTHTPAEVASVADIVRLGELLAAVVTRITAQFHCNRY